MKFVRGVISKMPLWIREISAGRALVSGFPKFRRTGAVYDGELPNAHLHGTGYLVKVQHRNHKSIK